MSKQTKKPVATAIGAAFVGSMMISGTATANTNPFGLTELNGGYAQIASGHMEGKCGAGKCGGAKAESTEGKCGAGKCGAGKCGGAKAESTEGKCGAGKCGAGKCGGAKAESMEGKCGAGKCGGAK